jgi:pimeloyl-ACP methyl ester carboxylesterase
MAVIATPEGYEKWLNHIQPGLEMVDGKTISNLSLMDYASELEAAVRTVVFDKPACILTGRQDNETGYTKPYELVDRFPRATFAALDCAGHVLHIDNEPLFQLLVKDWIWRIRLPNPRKKK